MKSILEYLKMHKKGGFLLGLWLMVFLSVFYLSAIPSDAVAYGMILFLTLGGCFVGVDFWQYTKKRSQMKDAMQHISISMEKLPSPENPREIQYQELLAAVFQYKCELESAYDLKYSEMLDYYTMWVHQVKTPIAAMGLLLQTEGEPDCEELLDQLFEVEEYVGMVLQYLRMGDMGADLKIRQFSLDGIVRQAVRKYSKSFIRKRISLDYEELDCTVISDEKWLVFVIEQLLSNAIKYTKVGKISIYMDKEREKTLVIEDTGIGIALEDQPRIFEKGFTGYNGRTDKKSTGIGLYLCKSIMNKLNHKIEIESVPAKGTKVRCGLRSAKLEVD